MLRFGRLALVLVILLGATGGWVWAHGKENCLYCGMYRSRFPYSWVELSYRDHAPMGFCSLHCAAIYLALHPSETPERVLVADYYGHAMIDADRAHWVVGGDLPGVMTGRAKWAFSDPRGAQRFMREHGGAAATFDQALEAAFQDMYRDTRTIQQRRQGAGGRDSSSAR